MTTCLRCRVVRLRIIAKSFLAFGRTPEQVKDMVASKNPDMEFTWTHGGIGIRDCSVLTASKDGWHFELARIPG